MKEIHSEWDYRLVEDVVDGVVEFKLNESREETRNIIRLRRMRNAHFDRGWHELKTGDNFKVTLEK
jgi:KaiC/GvpD/RAD55 family RecA-like ATPase